MFHDGVHIDKNLISVFKMTWNCDSFLEFRVHVNLYLFFFWKKKTTKENELFEKITSRLLLCGTGNSKLDEQL